MDYKVMISIEGCMTTIGCEEPDSMELITEGTLSETPQGYTLRYRESEITGLDGTETVFELSGDTITLTRSGDLSSQLVFRQDQKHYSMCSTPYGTLTIGINAYFVQCEIIGSSGYISVDYDIEIEHAMTGSNSIRIVFTPAED